MSKMGNFVIGLMEAGYDITDEAEFTAAWDKYKQQFNPFIACPECKGSDHVGQIEREEFKLVGCVYEPFGKWVDCDNCNGLGEIQADDNMEN
jgi:hypothetical protein|tara:strand:- start:4554 stop:4829 length:276 start_codon:yes stop_codon:yes gene_type:complete